MTSARRTLDQAISEAEWQATVVDLARAYGWRCLHVNDSRKEVVDRATGERKLVGDPDAKGLLDWLLVRRGDRLIFVELKREAGRLTVEQRDVIDDINAAGGQAYCWRPSDWPEVQRTLKLRAVPA